MSAAATWCLVLGALVLPHQAAAVAASEQPHSEFLYGPRRVRPALHYFRQWAAPAITRHLADELAPQGPSGTPGNGISSDEVLDHVRRLCSGSPPGQAAASWTLHASALDAMGTRHAVLLGSAPGVSLQYVALSNDSRLLAADPEEPCLHLTAARRLTERKKEQGVSLESLGKISPWTMDGQRAALLHPTEDHLVQDCTELFARTAFEKCDKDMGLEVVSAKLGVVGGMVVSITGRVHGEAGDKAAHKVRCAFEPRGKDVALRGLGKPAEAALPEEEHGLAATLIMMVDICKSDQKSSVTSATQDAINLVKQYRMGELSLYKGYRHVYDGLPKPPHWTEELQSKAEELPDSHNLVERHPSCFPDGGREVVANQGQCGSCWAFAAASSLMANICVRGDAKSSLASEADRFEISVQRILSCNPQGFGCDGGHAVAASDSFIKAHVSKAREIPYVCGDGDALLHFEEASADCESFPWGGSDETCDEEKANTDWHFGGIYEVLGEHNMALAISEGAALYVTFAVYEAFMFHSDGVYKSDDGELLGYHAVVALGYGVQDGAKYWLLQNSWGTWWGEHGFVKFLKGENLAGIEDDAIYLLGWPVGGEKPEPIGESVNKGLVELLEDDGHLYLVNIVMFAGTLWCCIIAWRCCCSSGSSPQSYRVPEDYPEKTAALVVASSDFDGIEGAVANQDVNKDCGCCGKGGSRPASEMAPYTALPT